MKNFNLTVIMTVYNNSQYLRTSIESILNQTGIDFYFLIIDDGSEEDIENIILEFNDARVKYIKLKKVGLVAALNEGIRLCQTEYIAIMDSDDIAPANRLKVQHDFLEEYKSIGLTGTSIKYITQAVNKSNWTLKMPDDHLSIKSGLTSGEYVLVHSTIMMRTEILKSVGGYHEDSYPVPDTDLFLRFAKNSELANISDIYSSIRLHKESLTAKTLLPIIKKNLEIIGKPALGLLTLYKRYFTLINYRKGIIYFIEKTYAYSLWFFFIAFLLSPIQSIIYIKKKLRFGP